MNKTVAAEESPPPPPPPHWLNEAAEDLKARYPDDRFEVIMRFNGGVERGWRVACFDCPGKLYTTGPNETLNNYEVHLKNRQHRLKVNIRANEINGA